MLELIPPWFMWTCLGLALLIGGALAVVTFLGRNSKDPEDRWRESSKQWARPKDIKELIADQDAPARLRLGWMGKHFVKAARNRSVLVMAPSGAGKTPKVVVPNVLKHQGPALVSSVKADLLHLTMAQRQRMGKVYIFDPTNATGMGNVRWSPLTGIDNYGDALRNATWQCDSSKSGDKGLEGQQYWDSQGKRCIAPCLLLAARQHASMTEISRWIKLGLDDVVEKGLDVLGEEGAYAKADWNSYAALDPRAKSSVAGTANVILDAWIHPDVRAATSMDPSSRLELLDLDEFLSGDNTLYLVAPASEQSMFTPIFETIVNAVLRRVERIAASQEGTPMTPPMLLALDEAANIAPLRRLDQVASKAAGEGVLLMSVWQDYAQIESIYGPTGARTVLSNHWAELYLPGITDPQTLRHVGDAIGSDMMPTVSQSYDPTGKRSTSTSERETAVAPADWLRKRPPNEVIVLSGRFPPMMLTLPGWYEDPSLRTLVDPAVAERYDRAFAAPGQRKRFSRGARTSGSSEPQVEILQSPPRPVRGPGRAPRPSEPSPAVARQPRTSAPSRPPVPVAIAAPDPSPARKVGRYEAGYERLSGTTGMPAEALPAASITAPALRLLPTPEPSPVPPPEPTQEALFSPTPISAPRPLDVPSAPAATTSTSESASDRQRYSPESPQRPDDVAVRACRLAISKGFITASHLERALGVSRADAEAAVEILAAAGIVTARNGSFPRAALIKIEGLDAALHRVRAMTQDGGEKGQQP